MNFFHHKDLGNHLLQLCPKVVKDPAYSSSVGEIKRLIISRCTVQHIKKLITVSCCKTSCFFLYSYLNFGLSPCLHRRFLFMLKMEAESNVLGPPMCLFLYSNTVKITHPFFVSYTYFFLTFNTCLVKLLYILKHSAVITTKSVTFL